MIDKNYEPDVFRYLESSEYFPENIHLNISDTTEIAYTNLYISYCIPIYCNGCYSIYKGAAIMDCYILKIILW